MKRMSPDLNAVVTVASPPGNGGRGLKPQGEHPKVLSLDGIAPRQRGAWIETGDTGARREWHRRHRPPATGGVD